MLARQPTDDLDPAPALAEGPLQQVAVADALAVLDREVQVGRQRAQVDEQALGRLGVASAPLLDEAAARTSAMATAASPGGASMSLRIAQ